QATTTFEGQEGSTKVTTTFDAESQNPVEMQKDGWQAILNSVKNYVESSLITKLKFKIEISAPVEKVFNTMLEQESYKQWTAAFNPTSFYEGSWRKGEKIYFIGLDENGKRGGMVAEIEENIPNEFISICHRGLLDGEEEILEGPQVEAWAV